MAVDPRQLEEACRQGAAQAAEALGHALGGSFSATPGELAELTAETLPDAWDGPGLVLALGEGPDALLALIPAAKWLPEWCRAPDEEAAARLVELARALGRIALPDTEPSPQPAVAFVENLAAAVRDGGLTDESRWLPWQLEQESQPGQLALVLALADATEAVGPTALAAEPQPEAESATEPESASASEPESESATAPEAESTVEPAEDSAMEPHPTSEPAVEDRPRGPESAAARRRRRIEYKDVEDGIRQLPAYARSLLKIEVPITVTLAATRMPLRRILELGPGAIIQFRKACEDPLTLMAGDQVIAEGEAVKVGDKFGLWITGMAMPDERFWVITGKHANLRAK